MAVRWLRTRRRPSGGHGHTDHDTKLINVDPLAWLADVLARIGDIPHSQLPALLLWNWDIGQTLMAPAA